MERTTDFSKNSSVNQSQAPLDDSQLHEAIMSALISERRIHQAQVYATVKNGVVTLSGTVPELNMKLYAEEAVEHIAGVQSIQNNIMIDIPPDESRIGAFSSSEKIM